MLPLQRADRPPRWKCVCLRLLSRGTGMHPAALWKKRKAFLAEAARGNGQRLGQVDVVATVELPQGSLLNITPQKRTFTSNRPKRSMAVGQNQRYRFGVGAPPILVGIGMFTGDTGSRPMAASPHESSSSAFAARGQTKRTARATPRLTRNRTQHHFCESLFLPSHEHGS